MDPAQSALEAFVREPGRSVYARVRTPHVDWSGGIDDDVSRPAASLLKLPLAMAIEPSLAGLAPQRVGDLRGDDDATVLQALHPDRALEPDEILRLMLSASDNACARWALSAVTLADVRAAARDAGARATTIEVDPDAPGMLIGRTTASDAVTLLQASLDTERFPISSAALAHSIRNSRIPLGATADDVRVAHKTGTLMGVAHDVAHLACRTGDLWVAFLTEDQHDTLVTGYEMGICTRTLLEHFALQVERTVSAEVTA